MVAMSASHAGDLDSWFRGLMHMSLYTVYMHHNTGIILGAWAKVFNLDVAAVSHQKL